MGTFEPLTLGFARALTPDHLLACLAGVVLGTVVGVLPGIGPVAAIALLLPFTFAWPPSAAIIMLAGIYYGAQYGGSITAILMNLPGEPSSAVTCVDGHAMARTGRARLALSVAAISSFVGGMAGTLLLATLTAPLTRIAAGIEAPDYVVLMVLGLVAAAVTSGSSTPKAAAMVVTGLLIGAIGTDVGTGRARWTLGIPALFDGIGLLPLAIGLYGLPEVIATLSTTRSGPVPSASMRDGLRPGEFKRAAAATTRGTAVGAVLGVVPGGGPVLATFMAYALEKAVGRHSRIGHGIVEGVAAPEAANNAAAQTSFIPLLTLGLPSNAVVALLLGALTLHGIQPGPTILAREPALFWSVVASMVVGNLLLLVLNLPLAGTWGRLMQVPYEWLALTTIVVSCVGVYSIGHSTFDVWITAAFGAAGYLLRTRGFDSAPLLLAFVLSRPLEENVRRTLILQDGAVAMIARPSVVLAAVALAALLWVMRANASERRPAG